MIDILEKSFTKPKVFNLKLMINARLKNQSLKQIDFMDYSFDGLHYTIEESMPSSTTRNYFSNNNTADQNLLVMTGEYIPVTSEAAQTMVQQIMKVVDKLDFSYHNPGPKAKDVVLKWAKKLKPKTNDQIWTEQDITQFKEYWLHDVLYNKDVANDSNCINSFEQLGINIRGFIGEMKDVEAKYFTFSPYANTVKTVISPAKVLSTVDVDNKKRKLENEKVTKTYLSKKPMTPCSVCGRPHGGSDCFLKAHPDANKDSKKTFLETNAGKIWQLNGKTSLSSQQRVEGRVLVTLEKDVKDKISSMYNPPDKKKGIFHVNSVKNDQHLILLSDEQITSKESPSLFKAEVGRKMYNPKDKIIVNVLLDTGSLQANFIHESVANMLVKAGAKYVNINASVKGFGPATVAISKYLVFDIEFVNENNNLVVKALVSTECNPDLIIGLPTMQFFNLFTLLSKKIMAIEPLDDITSQKNMAYNNDRINLLNNINIISDYIPDIMNIDTIELNEIVQNVQKLDFFNAENDDDDIPDESDLAFMSISNQAETSWNDVTFEGSKKLQGQLRKLCEEYSDVFAYKIRPQSAQVTPLHFEFDTKEWYRSANRLPSRLVSPEKQDSLCAMLDEYLSLGVIQSSKATAWSQVNLVRKPNGGWRFTLDFRGLNKAIIKTGGQIPHITNMLERLGRKHPNIFGSADLTQGYFQMPLSVECQKATAFITYRGLYEWTRVPMGIFPSAN